MKTERIDTDEIIGLTCPRTGNRILWDDEGIEDALRGTILSAVVTSMCPEECACDWMPLAAAWKEHYKRSSRKMTLDEVVEAFPASGKALKVVGGGIACGPVWDATYFILPETLANNCFIYADDGEIAETHVDD